MSNNFIAKSNTRRDDQHFFLNEREIYGIQSIDGSYQLNAIPLKYIGMDKVVMVPNGPSLGQFSLEASVIDRDYLLPLTGNTGFNGYIVKNPRDYTRNFSFSSGYLTSYTSRCSIGEIPQIAASFTVFGNMGQFNLSESPVVSGQLTAISGSSSNLSPMIAGPGSISINLDEFSTNRILSYDITVNVNRNAIYPVGSREPNKIETNYPIEVLCGVQFAMNDYEVNNIYDFPSILKTKNIAIDLKTFDTNQTIVSYRFANMFLVNERYTAGTEGQVVIDALYQGFYLKESFTGNAGTSGADSGSDI